MSWTYTGDPQNVRLDRIRLLIGDTIEQEPLLTDEEILWVMAEEPNDRLAAARCARIIASRFARQADITVGDLSVKFSELAAKFHQLAEALFLDYLGQAQLEVDTKIRVSDLKGSFFRRGQWDREAT